MTPTTEQSEKQETIDHLSAIISAMETARPDQEVIVCPICKTWRTVRKGTGAACYTCMKVTGAR
ncbi:hypothetical protein KKI24_22620 [bacterium]|nr:hypothetical protein [bacterium]